MQQAQHSCACLSPLCDALAPLFALAAARAAQVCNRLVEVGASSVPLRPTDVAQVLDALVYEGWLDYEGAGK